MKKLLYVATNIITMATLLVACGVSPQDDSVFNPFLDTSTRCSIKVVGDYDNFEALEAEFDRFNDYYPNVVLSYRKNDNYANTLGNALQQDDAPNIFFAYASWMSGDEKYNSILSHMENLSDPTLKLNLDCIRPGLINHDTNGKVFMAPIFSRTYGTLVNEDLFIKENINVPKNWTELLSACETFANKGYKSPIMGYSKGNSRKKLK